MTFCALSSAKGMDIKMKYCKKCILSDDFFSVKIEENGLCNYCNENTANSTKIVDMGIKPSGREYDVVLAYSGGKDSTYTLYLLRKKYYKLTIFSYFQNIVAFYILIRNLTLCNGLPISCSQ